MPESVRAVYSHAELSRLMNPCSLAVVGASPRASSFGLRTLRNLKQYKGAIYPINAKYRDVEGHACYPSLAALPEVPDCAILVVAREAVEAALEECLAAGVGGVIVYASNYAEVRQPEGAVMQARLVDMVRGTNTRLLGPNCMGVTNYALAARMSFGRLPEPRPLGATSIGIIAQSGAMSMSLAQAVERGISVSHTMTFGNGADVGLADMVSYLAGEPSCNAIACAFEGVPQPSQLIEALGIAEAAGKTVVVYKMATGSQGAAQALSHTGSLAGSTAAYRAAFEKAGAILVPGLEDVIETAMFFAQAGTPQAHGVAVASTSGGGGVMAADMAELHGVPLPQPAGATAAALRARIPDYGSWGNPCDLTAQVLNDEGAVGACTEAMLSDPSYSALVVHHTFADDLSTARIPLWSELAAKYGKPICNFWATEWLEGPGSRESETAAGVATFRSLGRCFAALGAWHERAERRAEKTAPIPTAPAIREAARQQVLASPNRTLTEREAKAVLAPYGVPVIPERLVATPAEAAAAAAALGLPVALKLESPDVPHKTEAGVIRLNLRTEDEVRTGCAEILARAEQLTPRPHVNGVLVQPMASKGVEVMVGARIDPQFGPLVLVGLGGVLVELFKDTAVALAPVTPAEAKRMLRRLKGFAALTGFRGSEPIDLDRLAQVVCGVAAFAADHADLIGEMDVNPLICTGSRISAVDALIVRT